MHDFGLRGLSIRDDQPDYSFHELKSLSTRCAGVYEQHAFQFGHPFDLQNVAVSTDKHIGWILGQHFAHSPLPAARLTGNVSHPKPNAGKFKSVVFRVLPARIPAVDISPYCAQRSEGRKRVDDVKTPNIARMQNQIHIFEISDQIRTFSFS